MVRLRRRRRFSVTFSGISALPPLNTRIDPLRVNTNVAVSLWGATENPGGYDDLYPFIKSESSLYLTEHLLCSQNLLLLATSHPLLRTFTYPVLHLIMSDTAYNDALMTGNISRAPSSGTPTLRTCLEFLISTLQIQNDAHRYISLWPLTNDQSLWSKAQKDWLVPRELSSDPSEVYRAQRTIGTLEMATTSLSCTFRFLAQMIIPSNQSTTEGYQIPLGISTTCPWADAVQTVLDDPMNRAKLDEGIRAGSWNMSGGILHRVVLSEGFQGEAATSVIPPGQTVGNVTNSGEAVITLCLDVREG